MIRLELGNNMNKKKRMIIELEEELHFLIKRRALGQRISLKDWVLIAIADRIKEEQRLEKEDE